VGDNPSMAGSSFLEAAARQASLASDVSRRPWPLPEAPWAQAETREEIVLAHWPAPAAELVRLLPPELELERFAGEAWLGAVGFRVRNLRVRGLPPLPGLSSLVELELRTYVTDGERPGVWLFSFEATNRLLVEAAKRSHRLPAYRARLELGAAPAGLRLDAERDGRRLVLEVEPTGSPARPRAGSLERFVCERYALYTSDGGRLYRAELHFSPWRVARARASLEEWTLLPLDPPGAPVAHVGAPLDLLVWPLEEV
jgi:uncharacterized protein YqjF (DUF2071 family)